MGWVRGSQWLRVLDDIGWFESMGWNLFLDVPSQVIRHGGRRRDGILT